MQIGNVDVDVNVDIECHTVGSLAPQNCQLQSNNSFSFFVIFAFSLSTPFFKQIEKVRAEFSFKTKRKTQVSGKDCAPLGEILHLRSRIRLRFQFAKTPYSGDASRVLTWQTGGKR